MDETRSGNEGSDRDSRFSKARDFVNEQYGAASGAARDAYNQVREKVEDVDFDGVADQVRTYVRSNPGKALLISIGAGFVLGLLLRRSDADEDEGEE
jgi:ElaB/YqjD/DUF883 family membrane-anchored ribosome-binding protein